MEHITQSSGLYYLTAKFPPRSGVYAEVVKRLNGKGFLTEKGEPYTLKIIKNAIRGHRRDDLVRLELITMLAEIEQKTGAVEKHLRAAEAILNPLKQIRKARLASFEAVS